MRIFKICLVAGAFVHLGCSHSAGSYSILAESKTFFESSSSQNTKIDVLWVIDNSGSMRTSQDNLTANFSSFIGEFASAGYDFQLAVTTTQAYLANAIWTPYYNSRPMPVYYDGLAQAEIARFRDGVAGGPHSGYSVLTPSTPDLADAFMINATQGTDGNGDERVFESMQTALTSPLNAGFLRSGAFLAVILLTDEDDFSNGTTRRTQSYSSLTPVDQFVGFLDSLTGSAANARKYNVSTIAVPDQDCLSQLDNTGQKIGLRVNQLADATGGIKGNICGDFAAELKLISKEIVKQSSQFYLGNSKPIPETIKVWINGAPVPNVAANPAGDGGWLYNAVVNSIMFEGIWTPPQGAAVQVNFDPEKVTF